MERKNSVTLSKITAVLCALVMLFGIIAFFSGKLTANNDYLKEQIAYNEKQIAQNEERIAQIQSDIAVYQKEKTDKQAELVALKEEEQAAANKVEEKQELLDLAEAELDMICDRASYSSWFCTEDCRAFHTAVTNKNKDLKTAQSTLTTCKNKVSSAESRITALDEDVRQAEENVRTTQSRITELRKEIKEIKSKMTGVWFVIILKVLAMLLALGGLGLLTKNFYTETQDKFTLYAVAGLAASSLLFLIAGLIALKRLSIVYILLNAHTWNLAIMGLFAKILLKKTEKPVKLRNIAVVLTVVFGVLAGFSAPVVGVLYVAAMICAAFVIVPLVFTEYIDIAKHIFLSIITFGIWQLVWTYHVTKNLNKVEAVEDRKPARELLLCMFLAFYYPFWLYKTAEGVEEYGKENGKEFKIDVLCIAFAFVCPLFATMLIQNKINVIVGKPVCPEPEIQEVCE